VVRERPNKLSGAIEGGVGCSTPAIASMDSTLLGKAGINIPDNALTRFLALHTSSEIWEAQKNIGYDPTQPKTFPVS